MKTAIPLWLAEALACFAFCLLPQTASPFAVAATDAIDFKGNNVTSDSFDSADPLFSTGGRYDAAKIKDNGDIITASALVNSLNVGNARIMGRVRTGPGTNTIAIGTKGAVGSKAWVQDGRNGIQPGWSATDVNNQWPDVALPASAWVPAIPGSYDIDGATYQYAFLGSGDFQITTVSGGVFVGTNANVRLKIIGNVNVGSADMIRLAGTMSLYMQGTSFNAGGSIENTSGKADAFQYFGLPGNTSINIGRSFIGTIYAPEAALALGGPGSATNEFIGACVVRSVAVNGHINFHCDENLLPKAPPSVGLHPQDQSVVAGQNATFTVSARGTAPFAYQWRFNGTGIPAATNSSYIITNASSGHAGVYSALITNAYGSALSSNAMLTINYPPSILAQPVSQAALAGSCPSFRMTAAGTAPLRYQWSFNGAGVAGATNASLNIDGVQLSQAGSYSVVVTNLYGAVTSGAALLTLTDAPACLWARKAAGDTAAPGFRRSAALGIATDAAGNILVAGTFDDASLDFGGPVLTNTGEMSAFICKYDASGNALWAKAAGTNSSQPWPVRVATDRSGNAFLAGHFAGTAILGTNSFFSASPADMFLAKYDLQGQVVWARQIGAYESAYWNSFGLATDGQGNVYLASRYDGTAAFGNTTINGSPAFIAKYDPSGNLVYARASAAADAIAASTNGALYVTGAPGILARHDETGALVWSRAFPIGLALGLDQSENIHVTGYGAAGNYDGLVLTNVAGSPDGFIAKCDRSGRLLWLRQLGSAQQQRGVAIGLDQAGDVYVSGISGNANQDPLLSFGAITLTNVQTFVAELDRSGNGLFARTLATTNRCTPRALAVADGSAVYVAGEFRGIAQFDGFTLVDNSPPMHTAMFVAKLAGIVSTVPLLEMTAGAGTAQIQFNVLGAAGSNYAVEASTDLVNWAPLETNTAPFVYSEAGVADKQPRFYRAVLLP